MLVLIIFFIMAIGFSFLCSILEAVLLSITPSYISIKEKEGSSIAQDLKKFKEDIDRPLSAILTLNTIAHTVGAIGVGAQAGKALGHWGGLNLFGIHIGTESIIATIMTLAVLILSEIIPKTIGANNWKALTPITVRTLKVLLFILSPLIWISQLITKGLKKDKEKSVLTRADFLAMTEVSAEEGVLGEDESTVIKNIMDFSKVAVHDIMTPRTVVEACQEDITLKEYYDSKEDIPYSRIPVYGESLDKINGYFLKDHLQDQLIKGNLNAHVKSIKRPIHAVSENLNIRTAFKQLMDKKEHIALVIDEFGGVEGIVTLEDIVETLIGMEITDEYDEFEDLQKRAKELWEKKASK